MSAAAPACPELAHDVLRHARRRPLAARLDLHDGDRVRVRSRHGEAITPLRLDFRVKPGELFASFHAAEVFMNNLTSPHRDSVAMTPEYKVVAVGVEKE